MSPEMEPQRLRDAPPDAEPALARLGRQLRILAADERMPALAPARRLAGPRRWPLIAVRLAAMAIILGTVGGGASATAIFLARHWRASRPSFEGGAREVETAASRAAADVRKHRGRGAAAPPREPSPSIDPPSEGAPPAEATPALPPPESPPPAGDPPERRRHLARLAARSSAAVGIAAEAEQLRRALQASRNAGDRDALILLDDYEARFPNGTLAWEASTMRARVLLRLGDRDAALAVLDRLPDAQLALAPGLMVTRGELRSLGARCGEGLRDFDAALRVTARLEEAERARALYGRASCRARMGDAAGAEQDRQRYLRDFPQGPAVDHLRRYP